MAAVLFKQWIATAAQVLGALGETARPGAETYFQASSQGPANFFLVEKLRVPGVGAGYMVYDSKGFDVQTSQIRAFLQNRGETLPANITAFIRPSTPGGLLNDEVVIMDATETIKRL